MAPAMSSMYFFVSWCRSRFDWMESGDMGRTLTTLRSRRGLVFHSDFVLSRRPRAEGAIPGELTRPYIAFLTAAFLHHNTIHSIAFAEYPALHHEHEL